jgi:hypothetical protein
VKFKKDQVTQVRTNLFFTKHFANAQKKSAQKCKECGVKFEDVTDEKIAGINVINKPGITVVCNDCARRYIKEYGLEDLNNKIEEKERQKEDLINKILDLPVCKTSRDWLEKIYPGHKSKDLEVLTIYYNNLVKEQQENDRIESIKITDKDMEIDQYLIDDYKVIQDREYLKDPSQIINYFTDNYDCIWFIDNPFEYNDFHVLIVKIKDKYFRVNVKAEIGQERGSVTGKKYYYVEGIFYVKYVSIPKPGPKVNRKF